MRKAWFANGLHRSFWLHVRSPCKHHASSDKKVSSLLIRKPSLFRYIFCFFFLAFSGCMVGPNYRIPIEKLPLRFAEDRTICHENPCLVNEDLAHWWVFFDDPFLNELLRESLCHNFDLKIAVENIVQARANFWVQVANTLPELDSDIQVTRSRISETIDNGINNNNTAINIPPIQSFYQAGLDLIWTIDVFGGLRRAARAALANWEASVENARGVRVLILSEVATTYTNICALQQLTEVGRRAVRLDTDLLALNKALFAAGLVNEQAVETALANLETDRAALYALEVTARQAIYSLAVLVGRPPETFLEQFAFPRPIPSGGGKVPVGLPSDLLRRRPDIRSAERQIAAATEQIGVAVASLFPQIALTGSSATYSSNPLQGANIGFASSSFSKWFTAPSLIWGIGAVASLPLWDWGKRCATIRQQVSIEHQAFYTYEKTVISALEEVESDLVAYFQEERRLGSLRIAADADERNFKLAADLYQAGLTDFMQVLTAEETWLNSVTTLISSQQALTVDLINLYQSLGGGWECSYMP